MLEIDIILVMKKMSGNQSQFFFSTYTAQGRRNWGNATPDTLTLFKSGGVGAYLLLGCPRARTKIS